MTIAHDLPTPRMALVEAHRLLAAGQYEAADTWIYLAKELREGSWPPMPPMNFVTPPTADSPDRLTLHDVEAIVCVHGRCAVRRKGGPGTWFLHPDDGSTCDGPENQAETDWRRRITASDVDPLPADDEPAYGVAAPTTTRSDLRESETTKLLDVSRLRPQLVDGLAETAVMRQPWQVGDETECAHCPYPIFVYAEPLDAPPSSGETWGPKVWIHRQTGQRVCPTPAGDETYHPDASHTFAEPRRAGTVRG